MKIDLHMTPQEAAQPEAHEVAQRAVLAALHKAGAASPPRGGEVEIVGDLAARASKRYEAMLSDMLLDLAKHT